MKHVDPLRSTLARLSTRLFMLAFLLLSLPWSGTAEAAAWNQIEPLKSRRADVERLLGKPIEDKPGQTGTLRFKVMGGMVTVSFVTAKFVATKKIEPELEGTVLQIVLQHERAPDSPDSLGLTHNSNFQREERQNVAHYRNQKEGIAYTFIDGKLRTTWYSPAAEQLARVQVRKK